MVGLLIWAEPKKGQRSVRLEERPVQRMRFLQAEIVKSSHGAILSRRVLAAGKKLRKRGVTQIVLPEAFPFREQIIKCGLRPVSTLALRRAIAADWVRTGLAEKGMPVAGARVAVSAAVLTGEAVRTVTELFDARTDLSLKNSVALRLYDEKQTLPSLALPPSMEEALPEGVDRGQLLAVLREAGVLKREQIALGSGKKLANGEA